MLLIVTSQVVHVAAVHQWPAVLMETLQDAIRYPIVLGVLHPTLTPILMFGWEMVRVCLAADTRSLVVIPLAREDMTG